MVSVIVDLIYPILFHFAMTVVNLLLVAMGSCKEYHGEPIFNWNVAMLAINLMSLLLLGGVAYLTTRRSK